MIRLLYSKTFKNYLCIMLTLFVVEIIFRIVLKFPILDLEKYKSTKKESIKTKELEEYENKIRELIDIKKPTRELLQTLIDKIEIDKDKNIEIFYRFMI